MFFLTQDNKYWDGKEWVENWQDGIVYGSASAAIAQAPNRTCKATGASKEQWQEYYQVLEETEVELVDRIHHHSVGCEVGDA